MKQKLFWAFEVFILKVLVFQGIPGDGRCLFRSVVHGASIRTGKPSPSESLQRELADELRAKVADEFVKRRADTEWSVCSLWFLKLTCIIFYPKFTNYFLHIGRFLEDDFETYVGQMRQPHSWGGEPELLMASHVLQMPITVYMRDKNDKSSSGLRIIAEYGQEYGKDNPIRVLYNGCGHYDALRSPTRGAQFKLKGEGIVNTGLGHIQVIGMFILYLSKWYN
ncbi:hypothetical protein CsatB_022491 [Cannabis sativa]